MFNQGLKGCYVMMSICGCEIMSSRNKSLSEVHFQVIYFWRTVHFQA
jgi:hypothetical protein